MSTNENFKSAAINGTVWKLIERVLAQSISLVVSIILARILLPSDYAVVSIVTIFFLFANVIISGGLNTALIQKKDADQEDYDSVFTLSLIISIAIYIILFFAAPIISYLYRQPLLIPIIRVMSLSLPIYACKSIVCAYIYSKLQFKKFFLATIGGTIVSAIVGIAMAVNGFGAWSLVAQQLSNTVIDTIILFAVTKIKLRFRMSTSKIRILFKYGWKIFLSSLIAQIYNQVNPLFIGLRFSSNDLSFYTKGRSFPDTLSSSISNTMSSVLFPVLAKCQDDKVRILNGTRRFMKLASFCVFPTMLGLFAISDTFVQVLLTSKWAEASYYIKIFSIVYMFDVIAIGNCETIKAIGRSDIYLKMEIIKKTGYFIVLGLFIALSNSPRVLVLSVMVNIVIQIIVNGFPNIKLLGYSVKMQILDLAPNLASSILMCLVVYFIGFINLNGVLKLIVQIFSGIVVYLVIVVISKNESVKFFVDYIKNKNSVNEAK